MFYQKPHQIHDSTHTAAAMEGENWSSKIFYESISSRFPKITIFAPNILPLIN